MPDLPDMLEPEFRPHLEAWAASPTPKTSGAVLGAVKPVIDSALRTYAPGGGNATIRAKAKQIVLDSLPRYDRTRAKLRTHLMVQLQSLRRASAEADQVVGVPERVRLDQVRLSRAENELRDRLGRDPSDAELSEHTGLGQRRLTHIRKGRPLLAEGSARGPNDDAGGLTPGMPALASDNQDAWIKFIYADRDPEDQLLMEHTLGLNGKPVLPKGELARRLNLSPGAISQRLAKLQRLIDARDELAGHLF